MSKLYPILLLSLGCLESSEQLSTPGPARLEKGEVSTDLTELETLSTRELCELTIFSTDIYEDEYLRVRECAGADLGAPVGEIEMVYTWWGGPIYERQRRQYGDIYANKDMLQAVALWGEIKAYYDSRNLISNWGMPAQHETPWPVNGPQVNGRTTVVDGPGRYVLFPNGNMLTWHPNRGVIPIGQTMAGKITGPTGLALQELGMPTQPEQALTAHGATRASVQRFERWGFVQNSEGSFTPYGPVFKTPTGWFDRWRNGQGYGMNNSTWDLGIPTTDFYYWTNPATGLVMSRQDHRNGVQTQDAPISQFMLGIWNSNPCLGEPSNAPTFVRGASWCVGCKDYYRQDFRGGGTAFRNADLSARNPSAQCAAGTTTRRTCSGRTVASATTFQLNVVDRDACVNAVTLVAENLAEAQQCASSVYGATSSYIATAPLRNIPIALNTQTGLCLNQDLLSDSEEHAVRCAANRSAYTSAVADLGRCPDPTYP